MSCGHRAPAGLIDAAADFPADISVAGVEITMVLPPAVAPRAGIRAAARAPGVPPLPAQGDATNYNDPRELDALAAEMRRNQAERLAPGAAVSADYGIVLGRLQRYEEARGELLRAVALDSRNARA